MGAFVTVLGKGPRRKQAEPPMPQAYRSSLGYLLDVTAYGNAFVTVCPDEKLTTTGIKEESVPGRDSI
jgi:hypothetical protein